MLFCLLSLCRTYDDDALKAFNEKVEARLDNDKTEKKNDGVFDEEMKINENDVHTDVEVKYITNTVSNSIRDNFIFIFVIIL